MEKNFVVKHLNRFFFKLNSLQSLKFVILFYGKNCRSGGMADATDSKSVVGNNVWVRVPLPAPNQYNPNQIFLIGDGFGLFVFFEKFEDTHFRNGVVKRPESKPRGPRKPKLAKDKEDNYEKHQKL